MRNFFLKTLYQKRWMALFWLLGMGFMTLMTLSVYNTFADSSIADSFKNLPAGLRKSIGDVNSFKTISGYISQQIYALRIPLLSIILTISLLVNLSAGDEQRGLLETQLTLPISRLSLLFQKLLAAVTIIAFASLGVVLGIEICLPFIHQHYALGSILKHAIMAYVLAVDFGLVAWCIGVATGRRGLALGVGSAFAFLSYLVDSLAPSVSSLQGIDKLSLFHYYPETFNGHDLLLFTALGLVPIIVGAIIFRHRDIKAS